jgi:RsiW-degrading membrane proteinase PrsW (M82 family)
MFDHLNSFLNTILIGIGIGFLPSIIWMLFWIREDTHPEPFRILLKAFFYGMLSVPFAIIFELWVVNSIGFESITDIISNNMTEVLIIVFIVWAGIEEMLKFAFGMRELVQKDDDEPVDPVIYMIVTALGFAALENILFIMSPLLSGDFVHVAAATHMRFMGATLLHILSSSIIGLAMGYNFYKSKCTKIFYTTLAACGAIALHAAFNIFIMLYESHIFAVFAIMWVLIIFLILAIERLKLIHKLT